MVRYRESTGSPSAVTASTVIVSFSLIFPSGQGREISRGVAETETCCSAISPLASASLQISSPVTVSSRSKQDRDRTIVSPSVVKVWAAKDRAGGGSGRGSVSSSEGASVGVSVSGDVSAAVSVPLSSTESDTGGMVPSSGPMGGVQPPSSKTAARSRAARDRVFIA